MAAHQAPPSLGFSRQEHWSGFYFLLQCMKVKSESEVAQSCPTLHDTMDCSLPGSSVHGIFQGRGLQWGAIAFSEVLIDLGLNLTPSLIFCVPLVIFINFSPRNFIICLMNVIIVSIPQGCMNKIVHSNGWKQYLAYNMFNSFIDCYSLWKIILYSEIISTLLFWYSNVFIHEMIAIVCSQSLFQFSYLTNLQKSWQSYISPSNLVFKFNLLVKKNLEITKL